LVSFQSISQKKRIESDAFSSFSLRPNVIPAQESAIAQGAFSADFQPHFRVMAFPSFSNGGSASDDGQTTSKENGKAVSSADCEFSQCNADKIDRR
jgi:hypothetical protein